MDFPSKMQGEPKNCHFDQKNALRARFCARVRANSESDKIIPSAIPLCPFMPIFITLGHNYQPLSPRKPEWRLSPYVSRIR